MPNQRNPSFNIGVQGFDPVNTGTPVDFQAGEITVNSSGISLSVPISLRTRTFYCYMFAAGTGVVPLITEIQLLKAGVPVGRLPLVYALGKTGSDGTGGSSPAFACTVQTGPTVNAPSPGNILVSLAAPGGTEPTQVYVAGITIPHLVIDEVKVPVPKEPVTVSTYRIWLGVLSTL